MTLTVAVDAELLVVNYLLSRSEVTDLVAQRISSDFPEPAPVPRIRITRTGGTSPFPYRIDQPRLYVEAFGNTKKEAKTIASTARAVLTQLPGIHAEGVVNSVDELVGPGFQPDRATAKRTAVPRYTLVAVVTTHPTP